MENPDSGNQGLIAPLALFAALGYALYRAHIANQLPAMVAVDMLMLLQIFGTLIIQPETARMLITFGGDGMGMMLATLLMSSFFFGKHTQLYKGSLRWGFVVMGAAAFIDMYATWWKARKDVNAIPYGTLDGMASDAMKLVEVHGWTLQLLVQRHVVVGACCLLLLTLVYAWGVRRAKSELDAQRLAQKKADWAHPSPLE